MYATITNFYFQTITIYNLYGVAEKPKSSFLKLSLISSMTIVASYLEVEKYTLEL